MLNTENPIFTGEDVLRIADIDRATLANWLRRGLLDRLHSEKAKGQHRRYSAADVVTITAMAKLCGLGLKPGHFEDRLAIVILSNAMHRYAARCGMWGETRPEHENLYRWLAIYALADGRRDWDILSALPSENLNGHGCIILVDCHEISDAVMNELEQLAPLRS